MSSNALWEVRNPLSAVIWWRRIIFDNDRRHFYLYLGEDDYVRTKGAFSITSDSNKIEYFFVFDFLNLSSLTISGLWVKLVLKDFLNELPFTWTFTEVFFINSSLIFKSAIELRVSSYRLIKSASCYMTLPFILSLMICFLTSRKVYFFACTLIWSF